MKACIMEKDYSELEVLFHQIVANMKVQLTIFVLFCFAAVEFVSNYAEPELLATYCTSVDSSFTFCATT